MFDARDKQSIFELMGVWALGVGILIATLIVVAIGAGVALSIFRWTGGV